jgi:hypothetical protein
LVFKKNANFFGEKAKIAENVIMTSTPAVKHLSKNFFSAETEMDEIETMSTTTSIESRKWTPPYTRERPQSRSNWLQVAIVYS